MLSDAKLQTVICSTQIDKALTFYGDLLGLRLKHQSEGALVFDVGGSDLRISPVPSMVPSEHTVAGFSVPDVTKTVSVLMARGLYFERFPGFSHDQNGILSTPGGSRVAWLRDPDGNLLSIVQFSGEQ